MTDNIVAAAAQQRSPTILDGSNRAAVGATFAATTGLVFGPSTFLLFVFGVFVEPLSKTFGWTKPSIIVAVTIVSLMIMVVSPLQGYLIDRFGARPIVLSSCFAFAIGLGGMYFVSSNISSFYIMYGLLPLLAIGLWPVSYLRVVSTWFERRLGLAIGIANGGIGLGAAILPPILTYIILNGSVQWAYVSLGIMVLVIVLPINALLLFESPAARPPRLSAHAAAQRNEEFKSLIRTQSFVILTLAFFLLGFVNTGLVTNQISLLIDGGATPQQAAIVQAILVLPC